MTEEKTEPATLHVEVSEETKPVLQGSPCVVTCPSSTRGSTREVHGPGLKDRDPHNFNSDVKVSAVTSLTS
jgi:hypothetical protein